jgi:hypothetical protein
MTTTDTTAQAGDSMRNGVDTATLFATLDAVKQAPQAAQFQFRAHNQWISGTHNRSTITDYFGVGEERSHKRTFVFDADHPNHRSLHDQGRCPGREAARNRGAIPRPLGCPGARHHRGEHWLTVTGSATSPVPAGRGRHNYPVTQRPSTSPGSGCFRCARRRTAARTAIPQRSGLEA